VSEVLAKIFESLNPTFELCLVDNSEGNRLTRFYNFNSSEDSYKSCFPSAGPRVFILAEVQPSAEERASFSLERRCDEIKDLGFANFLVNCAATHPQLNQKKFMARMSFLNAEKEAALEALEGVNADMVEPFIRQLSAESPVEFERFERARRGAKDAGFSKTSPRFAHLLHTCFLQGDGLLVSPESGAGRHIEG
jgi:hypothetical protein